MQLILKKYDFLVVTIYAKNIKKARLPLKNMQVREFSNDKIEFIYTGDVNELISYLRILKVVCRLTLINAKLRQMIVIKKHFFDFCIV